MPNELEGQEPEVEETVDNDGAGSQDELPEWAQQELAKVRAEAAERRVKLKEREKQIAELKKKAKKLDEIEESEMTEAQRLQKELEQLQAANEARERELETVRMETKLLKIASSLGIDPEVVTLLDVSKLDLDDEKAVAEKLKLLVPAKQNNGGGPSNPSTEGNSPFSEEALQERFFSGRQGRSPVFGG